MFEEPFFGGFFFGVGAEDFRRGVGAAGEREEGEEDEEEDRGAMRSTHLRKTACGLRSSAPRRAALFGLGDERERPERFAGLKDVGLPLGFGEGFVQ
jgi:hypothetical protein